MCDSPTERSFSLYIAILTCHIVEKTVESVNTLELNCDSSVNTCVRPVLGSHRDNLRLYLATLKGWSTLLKN